MIQEFRNDLQILRGLAIAAVWVFHLRPDLMPAGFLGVDVFFVLSGFLMCAFYIGPVPMTAGAFWLRRAKRILPAYAVVLLASVLVASFITLPHEFAGVIRSAEYSIALIPNVGFWMDNTYFDKAELKPLLHFWSLGVELQFYLIFPLIIWLHRKHWLNSVAITFASLLACIFAIGVSPKTSFFLTPFRLWQFMLGFAAAQLIASAGGARLCRGKAWIGAVAAAAVLGLTLLSIPESQHPKYYALLITILTAAIIAFGLPRGMVESPLGRLFVTLGNYSYSIYLVHFPVIVFWLYNPFHGNSFSTPALGDVAAIVATTLALSIALFHMVEKPIRALRSPPRFFVIQGSMAALVLVAVVVLPSVQRAGMSQRELAIIDAWQDRGEYRCGKFARIIDPIGKSCDLTPGVRATAPVFLLVGDSHADAIKETMKDVAVSTGMRLRLMVENCSLGRGSCAVASLLREIEKRHVATVVLHSSPGSMEAEQIGDLVREGKKLDFNVVLIDPVPVWPRSIPEALYHAEHDGRPEWLPRQSAADYLLANSKFLDAIGRISAPNFAHYSVAPLLCPLNCVYIESATGKPLYFDAGHLTLTGAGRLSPLFKAIFGGSEAMRDG